VALIGEGSRDACSRTQSTRSAERGVRLEVEVIRHRRDVDRRLSAVAEVDVPFYEGIRLACERLALTAALAEGQYDSSTSPPRPAGVGAWLLARS